MAEALPPYRPRPPHPLARGRAILAFALLLAPLPGAPFARAFSQSLPAICPASFLPPGASLDIVERSDFHRYVEGRNLGLVYRESRGVLRAEAGGFAYEGEVYIFEENYRDPRSAPRRVVRNMEMRVDDRSAGDTAFPSLRGLLFGAPEDLAAGATWISSGSVALDPRGSGGAVFLPFLAEYRSAGEGKYGGRDVLVIKAKFALRTKAPSASLKSASGSHELDIYLDKATKGLVLIRDKFDEAYTFADAPAERHEGFTFVFFSNGSASDRAIALAELSGRAEAPKADPVAPDPSPPSRPFADQGPDPSLSSSGPGPFLAGGEPTLDEGSPPLASPALAKAGVDLLDGSAGIVLRIKDLPFVADSEEIVASERWRLDAIADSLRGLPGSLSFLVEGHSAGVGKAAGELALSERRAKKVVDELVARGIAPSRLLYRGLGSSRPLAPNDTEAGRSMNRRVEITILE